MTISLLAGKPAPKEMLIDPVWLEREYFERRPDLDDPNQLVSFGTSGHRGSPMHGSFTEAHILAITQAKADQLVRVIEIGAALEIFAFEPDRIDQHLLWRRLAGKR